MLSDFYNTSATGYMQTIFRARTPVVIGGKTKDESFVFDFARDRTLRAVAEATLEYVRAIFLRMMLGILKTTQRNAPGV